LLCGIVKRITSELTPMRNFMKKVSFMKLIISYAALFHPASSASHGANPATGLWSFAKTRRLEAI